MQKDFLPTPYAMEAGDGPISYAKNSTFQKSAIDSSKELILKAVAENLDLKSMRFAFDSSFVVADFGCSTGPNTFISVQNILEAVELEHKNLTFQVFFNDHVTNDFNTLFKTLPSSIKYYVAGVPGSFHTRLFPDSSIHIAHSSYSLHWLSKVPEGVVNNKGKIFWNGADEEVGKAYVEQYEKDMNSFLSARASELVFGGLLMMCFTVRPNDVILNRTGFMFGIIGSCLVDMANEGMILEEDVDSFNIPIYNPTFEELEGIIHNNGCFSIEKMDVLHNKDVDSVSCDGIVSLVVAVFRTLIGEHFGYGVMDEFISRFRYKIEQNHECMMNIDYTDAFIILKFKCKHSHK